MVRTAQHVSISDAQVELQTLHYACSAAQQFVDKNSSPTPETEEHAGVAYPISLIRADSWSSATIASSLLELLAQARHPTFN